MTTIQIRIDEKTKNSAKKILDNVGMDISSAIKIYLKQIVVRQGIPFKILTENGMTIEQENEILKASAGAKKGHNITAVTKNWKETKAFLDSLKKESNGSALSQKFRKKLQKTTSKNKNKGR